MTKLHLVSGLPRSGSTLLCNILAQNPAHHATPTSGLHDVLFGVRNTWDLMIEHRAAPDSAAKKRVMQSIVQSYHTTDRPIVFDKGRGWLSLIEMIEWVMDSKVKVLVPVRDVREVLASFEKIHRKQAANQQPSGEASDYITAQTVEGRCEILMRPDGVVGLAYSRLRDALQRGFADRLCLIRFKDLTTNPKEELAGIHNFLELPAFDYNFDAVEQYTKEDDSVHGADLHTIRPKIEPVPSSWFNTLGDYANRFAGLNFWQ